jgi:hypothetical protein
VMTSLFSVLFRCGVKDPQIGFKLYKAQVLKQVLPQLRLGHDGLKSAEILVKADAFGYKIKEIPVVYKHDEDSRCVPKGNYRVVFEAGTAVLRLWVQSYVEFKKGLLPVCPVRFSVLLWPIWRFFDLDVTKSTVARGKL